MRGQRRQHMQSRLSNDMGPVTKGKDPTVLPDWQVLLSAYAPLVLYGAACAAARVFRQPSSGQRR